jgi:hypothetical protein
VLVGFSAGCFLKWLGIGAPLGSVTPANDAGSVYQFKTFLEVVGAGVTVLVVLPDAAAAAGLLRAVAAAAGVGRATTTLGGGRDCL